MTLLEDQNDLRHLPYPETDLEQRREALRKLATEGDGLQEDSVKPKIIKEISQRLRAGAGLRELLAFAAEDPSGERERILNRVINLMGSDL